MSDELDDFTHAKITELSEKGNQCIEDGRFNEAVECFKEALDRLPEPVEKWEAATWLLGAIGDAYFLNGQSQEALQPLLDAMKCTGGIGNAFLHLRLGQVQLDLGNEILAADELARAYMGAGRQIFEGESPKYFAVVMKTIRKPAHGW